MADALAERKRQAYESSRRWKLANPDRVRASAKAWRLAHLEQAKASAKAWKLAHLEEEKARQKAYRLAHPEKGNAASRKWRLAHPEQEEANNKAYRLAHPEKVRTWSKAYRLAHREKVKAKNRAWELAHPEERCIIEQRRRARKQGLPDTLTAAEWQAICASFKFKCAYCGKRRRLTMDHVIPLSKNGGTTANNIVPACQSCNSSKRVGPPPQPINLALGV